MPRSVSETSVIKSSFLPLRSNLIINGELKVRDMFGHSTKEPSCFSPASLELCLHVGLSPAPALSSSSFVAQPLGLTDPLCWHVAMTRMLFSMLHHRILPTLGPLTLLLHSLSLHAAPEALVVATKLASILRFLSIMHALFSRRVCLVPSSQFS